MEITVKRNYFSSVATMGQMYINGEKVADTLEDKYRELAKECPNTPKGKPCNCPEKVYGQTCIPCGKYKVTYRYSPKFGKSYPAIENVLHFLGVLIHAGSNVGHTEGCILTGERVAGKEELKNQFQITEIIKKKVKAAFDSGEEIWITIVNEK